eukprot:TRINITY_DN1125_c0_g1_i1.p1 TRINITY_DN1125_c0_g1~~TRINITY_DN1125_c0_g1_i1.p1  ORF type:complete len:222 (+),score=49.79 TRINITY_DN1125_c0_g1_i1:85-750(+)
MADGKYHLYSYWRSSCSWRVRIALAMKGIEYEYHAINLLKAEQKSDDYSTHNPSKQIPTLVLPDGTNLCQSLAILEYLDEVFPDREPLLPRGNGPEDAVKRARVRHISEIVNSFIQPLQNPRIPKLVYPDSPDKALQFAADFIREGFQSIEKVLANTAGRFAVGDQVTIADLCLVPQVYNAHRHKVDMSEFPIILRVTDNASQLPAFQNSHPSKQPDATEH